MNISIDPESVRPAEPVAPVTPIKIAGDKSLEAAMEKWAAAIRDHGIESVEAQAAKKAYDVVFNGAVSPKEALEKKNANWKNTNERWIYYKRLEDLAQYGIPQDPRFDPKNSCPPGHPWDTYSITVNGDLYYVEFCPFRWHRVSNPNWRPDAGNPKFTCLYYGEQLVMENGEVKVIREVKDGFATERQ